MNKIREILLTALLAIVVLFVGALAVEAFLNATPRTAAFVGVIPPRPKLQIVVHDEGCLKVSRARLEEGLFGESSITVTNSCGHRLDYEEIYVRQYDAAGRELNARVWWNELSTFLPGESRPVQAEDIEDGTTRAEISTKSSYYGFLNPRER